MGTTPTVYQAELTAILRATEALLPFAPRGQIIIHRDSQAALKALNSPVITLKRVLTTAIHSTIWLQNAHLLYSLRTPYVLATLVLSWPTPWQNRERPWPPLK